MKVVLYLERFADLGETCLLLQEAGLVNIATHPDEDAISGDIDSRQVSKLVKVKGVGMVHKGMHAETL